MPLAELTGSGRRRKRRRRWAQETTPEPVVVLDTPTRRIEHDLSPLLPRWAKCRSRWQLERDPSYRAHREQVEGLLRDHQWDMRLATATATCRPGRLRAVCWNIERGKRWESLCGVIDEHPDFADLDVLLLCEVDDGMGRSENRDVAARLAERLGMGFVFSPSHLVLTRGDTAEQDHDRPNDRALHGVAVLSRFPVRRVLGVGLPEFGDKLLAVEKRLGSKRALWAELDLPGGPLWVCVVHLDPFASPAHRGRQMRHLLARGREVTGDRVLLGGDFNTTTYSLGTPPALALDLAHKMLRFGFAGTVEQYMTPQRVFERPLFTALRDAGLSTDGFVDRAATLRFDLNDPEVLDKAARSLPRPALRWLQRRLEPWGGSVPMRFDWFAGAGVEPSAAWTVGRPRHRGRHVSDHDPVGVELRWPTG